MQSRPHSPVSGDEMKAWGWGGCVAPCSQKTFLFFFAHFEKSIRVRLPLPLHGQAGQISITSHARKLFKAVGDIYQASSVVMKNLDSKDKDILQIFLYNECYSLIVPISNQGFNICACFVFVFFLAFSMIISHKQQIEEGRAKMWMRVWWNMCDFERPLQP